MSYFSPDSPPNANPSASTFPAIDRKCGSNGLATAKRRHLLRCVAVPYTSYMRIYLTLLIETVSSLPDCCQVMAGSEPSNTPSYLA